MRARPLAIAVLLFAVACPATQLLAQRPYAWVMPQAEPTRSVARPFSLLLDRTEELALTAEQVSRVQTIQRGLVERNERLLAVLRDAEVMKPTGEEEIRAVEMAREQVNANAARAEADVRELLTSAQLEQARQLIGDDNWAYPPAREEPAAGEVPPTTLVVENHNYYDATIYVVSGPRRQRLGFVAGLQDETFEIPPTFLRAAGAIRLEVQQIPQHRLPLTDEVIVVPGNLVFLRIPPS